MENLDQIVEAIVFASGNKISKKDLLKKMPMEVSRKDINKAIRHLAKRYSGKSGIHFTVMENDVQFTTNPDYGEIVADVLQVTKEKELSKVLLEVLSIIAYKGPITKTQIEDIRNTNSEYAVSALCRFNLIYPCGRADTLGKPMLYRTTPEFLQKFGLKSLKDLPDKEEVLSRLSELEVNNSNDNELFRRVDTDNLDDIMVESEDLEDAIDRAHQDFVDTYLSTQEVPDFLEGEEGVEFVDSDDFDDEEDVEEEVMTDDDSDYEDEDESFFDDDDDEEDDDDSDDVVDTGDDIDDYDYSDDDAEEDDNSDGDNDNMYI